MADKLAVYRNALLFLDERKIASLSDTSESRRALDDAWDNTVDYCLAQGIWNFAVRTVQIDASASVTPAFGFSYAFTKPSDCIRLYQMSSEETFTVPFNTFRDEAGYWYADSDPLYARYVSNDTAYGNDVSLWPPIFVEYVACRLAARVAGRITGSDAKVEYLTKLERRLKQDAASKDAMDEGPIAPPRGTWVRSRTRSSSVPRPDWNGTTLV